MLQLSVAPRAAPRAAGATRAPVAAPARRSTFAAGAAVAVAPRMPRAADRSALVGTVTVAAKRASAAASGQVRVDIQGRHLEVRLPRRRAAPRPASRR